jgi:hypothetical protein
MNPRQYIRGLRPALDGVVMMTLAVGVLKWSLSPRLPIIPRLLLEIATGAIIYTSTLLLLHRDRILTFVRVAKDARTAKA